MGERWKFAQLIHLHHIEQNACVELHRFADYESAEPKQVMYVINVPRVPPSPNYSKWRHHMAKYRLRELWRQELKVGIACARHRNELKALAKKHRMRVEVTIHHNQMTDDDNIAASLKPVLDGLKNLGYIKDDSPEHLHLVLPVTQVLSNQKLTVLKISAIL